MYGMVKNVNAMESFIFARNREGCLFQVITDPAWRADSSSIYIRKWCLSLSGTTVQRISCTVICSDPKLTFRNPVPSSRQELP